MIDMIFEKLDTWSNKKKLRVAILFCGLMLTIWSLFLFASNNLILVILPPIAFFVVALSLVRMKWYTELDVRGKVGGIYVIWCFFFVGLAFLWACLIGC